MKKQQYFKRMSILLAALLGIAVFSVIGSGCGDISEQYSDSKRSAPVADSGRLTSFVERQTYGTVSGNNRLVDYYVYSDYSGIKQVRSIRAQWTIKAEYMRQTGQSFSYGLNAGSQSIGMSVGASANWEYTDQSVTLYWNNTNGATHAYYRSNYTLFPNDHIRSHSISNLARLEVVGHATPFIITAAV